MRRVLALQTLSLSSLLAFDDGSCGARVLLAFLTRFSFRQSRASEGSALLLRLFSYCFLHYDGCFPALLTKMLARKRTREFQPRLLLWLSLPRQDRELLGAISRGLLDCPCRV